jgi:hypothetical protein
MQVSDVRINDYKVQFNLYTEECSMQLQTRKLIANESLENGNKQRRNNVLYCCDGHLE